MSARCSLLVVSGVFLFSSMLMAVAMAQNSADESGTSAYEQAIHDLLSQGHVTSLEIFLEDYPNSPLRKDALELLIWNYEQNQLLDKAAWAARRLLRTDPENAAALAVMAAGESEIRIDGQRAEDRKLTRNAATRGLLALPSLTAPHGISAALFDNIRREVKAILDNALGVAALKSKDYLTAQMHLREAVAMTPEDVNCLYSLALSYLHASPPDNKDGMWFLARVANLASAPRAGQADSYGRNLSRTLYGSESRWEDLLRETQFVSFPEFAPATTGPMQEPSFPATSTSDNKGSEKEHNSAVLKIRAALFGANQVIHVVPHLEISVQRLDRNHEAYSRTVMTDGSGTTTLSLPPGRYGIVTPRGVTSGQQWYTWNLEVLALDPQNYIELTDQNAAPVNLGVAASKSVEMAPVSQANPIFLGIVVDDSASMASRLSIVKNGLFASVRQLRPGQQSFVLESGGRPRITQGLTSDPVLLQRAIHHITPEGGSALYDGVIKAAEYLRQGTKGGTLALLVIADQEDTASHGTLKQALTALRSLHAATYCIGTQHNDDKLHDQLTLLASDAGNEALFPRLANLTIVSQSFIERLQDHRFLSAPDPSPADADVTPQTVAARGLHTYSAITVKEFVVEDGPDTAGFPGGDEMFLQKLVIGRMRKYTSFREVADGNHSKDFAKNTSPSSDRVTLAGIVVGYNSGGRVRRDLIGAFGGVMTLTVRFVFRDAQTGDEIFRSELTSTGGPVFFGGSTEEMRSQAMLRLADSLIKAINKAK